ncbi:Chromobox protein 3 [Orchesella cincta]|uniref:Chromobox protein 3 n=1 Tax=Orchesella cincta TaxID=48709 RepID=A0A1D2NGY9_ORCCI|nr:Chromobox protein 3 [Orchesella cincta]
MTKGRSRLTKRKARRVMSSATVNGSPQQQVVSSAPPLPGGASAILEDEYVVEKILDRRESKGQVFYLIKWQGFSDQDNTWEPYDNVSDCPELIKDFEERLVAHEELKKENPIAAAEQDIPNPLRSNVADMVPAREANVKCPQIVIKFYEERIKWNSRRSVADMLGVDEANGAGHIENEQ